MHFQINSLNLHLSIFATLHFVRHIALGYILKLFERMHSSTGTRTASYNWQTINIKLMNFDWNSACLSAILYQMQYYPLRPVAFHFRFGSLSLLVEEWLLPVEDLFQPLYVYVGGVRGAARLLKGSTFLTITDLFFILWDNIGKKKRQPSISDLFLTLPTLPLFLSLTSHKHTLFPTPSLPCMQQESPQELKLCLRFS